MYVTLIVDLLTSNSSQFVFVPTCIDILNLVKFPWAVHKTSH